MNRGAIAIEKENIEDIKAIIRELCKYDIEDLLLNSENEEDKEYDFSASIALKKLRIFSGSDNYL